MTFAGAVKNGFRTYATFSGRASRSEYWWWILFVVAGSVVLSLVDLALFGSDPRTGQANQVLSGLFQLGVLLPTLGLGWRRLHDSGRPGWYLLLPFLVTVGLMFVTLGGMIFATGIGAGMGQGAGQAMDPGAGMIAGGIGMIVIWLVQLVLLVLMIWWLTRPSDPGENTFGPPRA
ncbi:MAG: DUF805 domain-containing protein [Rhodobacteraceae bacterium]|mgnify:CR=1 FL=1|jgi:uncharacterized membrane protein YhaH (DUF805 family)|uniref:Putative membrane protein n=1 Tax=Salipiger profundus TaxID=1229727 RepID=A0A1U7D4Q2_9RHOB|nr:MULTISPECIES: DUF805 domain-containing protein [Salipiger]APX23119.1 putative membrane protein [Salipiger profundus]MAB04778.1 DUF805 domain-containing protein [Paracoccaceae bacterium]GGA13453.1 hypothetical protein GCM10011326_26840 [Salipiger profundus]SFD18664.1 Uncharacterized membrane protein YhaH, DUF805 family [Salipiger profundus]